MFMIKYTAVKIKVVKTINLKPFTKVEQCRKPRVLIQWSFLKNSPQGHDLSVSRHHFQDWIPRILRQNTVDQNFSCSQENYIKELSSTDVSLTCTVRRISSQIGSFGSAVLQVYDHRHVSLLYHAEICLASHCLDFWGQL